jgi:hypothetical protein
MSKHHYPRYDSRRKMPPNTPKTCEVAGCGEKAKWQVFVQVSYMRGDDDDYRVCEAHRKFDPEHMDEWLASMRATPTADAGQKP